jgi:hypothetical protein
MPPCTQTTWSRLQWGIPFDEPAVTTEDITQQ